MTGYQKNLGHQTRKICKGLITEGLTCWAKELGLGAEKSLTGIYPDSNE
jgi:hypothetical protein